MLRADAFPLTSEPVANDMLGIIVVPAITIPIARLEVRVAGHDAPTPLPLAIT